MIATAVGRPAELGGKAQLPMLPDVLAAERREIKLELGRKLPPDSQPSWCQKVFGRLPTENCLRCCML